MTDTSNDIDDACGVLDPTGAPPQLPFLGTAHWCSRTGTGKVKH